MTVPTPREPGATADLLVAARQEIALWRATMPHPITPPIRLRLLERLVARCEQAEADVNAIRKWRDHHSRYDDDRDWPTLDKILAASDREAGE